MDHRPVGDDEMLINPAPFHVGHGNAADRTDLNGVKKFPGGESGNIPGALHFLFFCIHGLGDVDGQDKFDVHFVGRIIAVL